MKHQSVPPVPRSELETMSTRALLGRLRRLRGCEESVELSDMGTEEAATISGILFKQSPEWKAAYADLKAVLAMREHVPREPAVRQSETGSDNRRPRPRRQRIP